MKTVLDYLESESAAHASTLHLDLDFSHERPEQICAFCTWLRTHLHLNRIDFKPVHRPSTGLGTDLSRLSGTVLDQIFAAIRDNQRIQTIVLPQCNLTHISDVEGLNSISDCLKTKRDVTIVANRDQPCLRSDNEILRQMIVHIAVGNAEKLKLQDIISSTTPLATVRSFFTDLVNATNKTFQYLSLPHNRLDGNTFPDLIKLAHLKIFSLDLSENPLALGASLADWSAFFQTLQNNHALDRLSLKGCELWRGPIASGEDKTKEQCFALFKNLLLNFVRETHLSSLDLDLNEWEDEFLEQLREAAQHNPRLYHFRCGHQEE